LSEDKFIKRYRLSSYVILQLQEEIKDDIESAFIFHSSSC